jgi:Ca-activated chloride channel family protein
VPRERATVLVAVDVSRSMLADDVAPDRLTAARDAAQQFVDELPEQFRVGLVGFAGTASVFVPPSDDRSQMAGGIERLVDGSSGTGGTAIGDAIAASLEQIRTVDAEAGEDVPPARVVVLSDGANTSGRDPADAAAMATQLGVPVDAISFGTPTGTIGGGQQVPVDGETLRSIADATGGRFFEAGNAEELRAAYADIGSSVGYQTEVRDISFRFIGVGLALAVLAALASMFWFARLP